MKLVKVNGAPAPKVWGSILDEFFNEAWGKDAGLPSFSKVPANIHETNDAYHIEVSVPGLKKEDINISIDKDLLTISYEKKEETKSEEYKTVRREFHTESFKRSFSLSEKINAEAIQAKYENGVLTLQLPKKEELQPSTRQITIS